MTDTIGNWEANAIRFVLFPAGPSAGLDIWRELFDAEPDSEETRPKEGFRRQSGPYRDGQLEIQIMPGRIDIVLGLRQPAISPAIGITSAFSSGDFATEMMALAETVRPWIARSNASILRLSIAGAALTAADSVEHSYEILKKYVKSVNIDSVSMRDLNYRVNWKKPSLIDDIAYYNRLTTFSSLIFALQGSTHPTSPFVSFQSNHFACLELDINTPAERTTPLAPSSLVAIFDDLLSLAVGNLEHGECLTDV